MVLIKKNKYIQSIIVILFTSLLVSMGNKLSESRINTNNKYNSIYQEKMSKGFLTEREITQLKSLEKEHLEDNLARNNRLKEYFGTLTVFMLIMSALMFWGKYKMYIYLNSLIISVMVLLTAIIITGSAGQSIFWSVFALAGSLIADYFTRHRTV